MQDLERFTNSLQWCKHFNGEDEEHAECAMIIHMSVKENSDTLGMKRHVSLANLIIELLEGGLTIQEIASEVGFGLGFINIYYNWGDDCYYLSFKS